MSEREAWFVRVLAAWTGESVDAWAERWARYNRFYFRWDHHEIVGLASDDAAGDLTVAFRTHDPAEMLEALATADLWPWPLSGEGSVRWTELGPCELCEGRAPLSWGRSCAACGDGPQLAPASTQPPSLETLAAAAWAGPLDTLREAFLTLQASVGLVADRPVFRGGRHESNGAPVRSAWRGSLNYTMVRVANLLEARGVALDATVPFVFCYAFKFVTNLK